MSKEKIPEMYRLNYEYLKRSPKYKAFCNFIQECEKKPENVFNSDFEGIGIHLMLKNYDNFNDVFSLTVDECWSISRETMHDMGRKAYHYNNGLGDPILYLEAHIDICLEKFIESEHRQPSLDEFKKLFLEELDEISNEEHRSFLVNIDRSLNDTIDQMKTIQEGFIKRYSPIKLQKRKSPDFENLRNYLFVYDLKKSEKRITWPEIKKRLENEKGKSIELRPLMRYPGIAKEYIKNAEKHDFPGQLPKKKIISV
jgi:hypothetical protein